MVPLLFGFAFAWTSITYWGFDGVTRAKEWVSPDGRMSLQGQLPNIGTAVDYWPTASTLKPTEHSIAEITLNRCLWSDPCVERLSLSAMVDQTDGGAYRVSIEKGGTGQHRPLLVCFDNAIPGGAAVCPLKIDPTGVYIWTNGGYTRMGGP
jgi:hypothetical protein